jgi:hypothetical protein
LPQKVICQGCGCILYEDIDLKSPEEIIQQHDGKCPSCGKKLTFAPENIDVRPVGQATS